MTVYAVTRGAWDAQLWGGAGCVAHCATVAAAGADGHGVICHDLPACLNVCTQGRHFLPHDIDPTFTDLVFALLAICFVLITSVMVVMLSSLSSDNSCAFAIMPGTFTSLPEINRFSYAFPKYDFMLTQSWLGNVNTFHSFRWV